MRQKFIHFALAVVLYYLIVTYAKEIIIMPAQVVRISAFLPPLLGLMWGPAAAFGVLVGEILTDSSWSGLIELWEQHGIRLAAEQAFNLFYTGALWAFLSAFLPWKLWHSLLVSSDEPRFRLAKEHLLKFVFIIFITFSTVALFMGLVTDAAEVARLFSESNIKYGRGIEYAIICFVNSFDMAIFFGVPLFLLLVKLRYPFVLPNSHCECSPQHLRIFDSGFAIVCTASIILCLPISGTPDLNWTRLLCSLLLLCYAFRPTVPLNEDIDVIAIDVGNRTNQIAALLLSLFFLAFFFMLNHSGIIHDLDKMDTWHQFSIEILTMMDFTLVTLLYLLLRYSSSIMTNMMLLDMATVFVSAIILGVVSFVTVDHIIEDRVNDDLEKMSIICREHLARSFDGIEVAVSGMQDLAIKKLESYDRIVNDEAYRMAYLADMEQAFASIANNTNGSVSFYMRLAPDAADTHKGFFWASETGQWEGNRHPFIKQRLTDMSMYDESDVEHVGWYYIPIRRQHATWLEPYMNANTGIYMISYVVPIYSEGNLLGIIGMDVDFDYIIHEIRRMSVYEHGYAYLIDRYGRVLYHKNYQKGDRITSNSDIHEAETYMSNGIWLVVAGSIHEIYADRNNMMIHLILAVLTMTMILSCFSIWLASLGIRPLLSITNAAKKIAAGDLDVRLDYNANNEIGALVSSIKEMVEKLEVYVYRDKLTGVRNTAAYMRMVHDLDKRSRNENLQYAVVVFDVNFLKRVNDRYGHEAGNELIQKTAATISRVFPKSPVYRIGGDEFVTILEHDEYTHREQLLNEFDEQLSNEQIKAESCTMPISVARGLSIYQKGTPFHDVFRQADDAMYQHKAAIKKKYNIGENER